MSKRTISEQLTSRASFVSRIRGWASDTFPPILAIVAIDVALALIFLGVSAPSTHIGTLRPEATIPPKLLQLASVGLGIGLLASLAARSFDLRLITFGFAFTILLDLDHLPSVFGVEQTIRPDHSLAFLGISLVVLSLIVARGRPEIPVIFSSAFFGHMAADTGLFAFFAPISFDYTSLNELKIPFAILAIGLAILSGFLKFRRMRKQTAMLPKAVNVS